MWFFNYFLLLVIIFVPLDGYCGKVTELANAIRDCSDFESKIAGVTYVIKQNIEQNICLYIEKLASGEEMRCTIEGDSKQELYEIFNAIDLNQWEQNINNIHRLTEIKEMKCLIIDEFKDQTMYQGENNIKQSKNEICGGLFKVSRNTNLMRRLKISALSIGFGV